MIGLNNYIPTQVHTQRGIIDIKDLIPGDLVYEYKSGRQLEVKSIIKNEITDIWELSFEDGRKEYYNITDLIYTGHDIMSLIEVLKSNQKLFYPIKQYALEFNPNKVRESVYPDPYIAGALIGYGDYDDPYLNLPIDKRQADQLFSHKYNLDFADRSYDRCHFKWNGKPKNSEPITWREFFPKYDFFATSKRVKHPMIPNEYMFGSIKTRRQFIRGVFDLGYQMDQFPNSVVISNKYEYRLLEIQKMLISLGVISRVTYDPLLKETSDSEFRLDIIDPLSSYPGFFYKLENIQRMIYNSRNVESISHVSEVNIMKAKQITRGYTYNIILEKPNMLYLSGNLLPRVSD